MRIIDLQNKTTFEILVHTILICKSAWEGSKLLHALSAQFFNKHSIDWIQLTKV